jgi:endonuclease YncB( thermonuclease family)
MTAAPASRFLVTFTLLLSGVMPAAAEGPAVCGGKSAQARIIETMDGTTFRLEDGRVVRLANVIPAMPIDGDRQALLRAKEALAEIANGKHALLYFASESKDRYGRISVQAVLLEEKIWLESELVSRGLARVFPSANDKCMTALLQFESKARSARAGLWNESKFGVFDAENVEALLAAEGRFAVVEGAVRRVGESRGRLYLDFGRRFTEDFTVVVPDRLRKNLVAKGSDPKSWRGKRIRVRGILFSWGGPAMEINLAQAIELLD